MSATAVSVEKKIPKPNWRNIQLRMFYRNCINGMIISTVASVLSYYYWYIPKYAAIEEYER